MANALYANGAQLFLTGGINWLSDTINATFVDSTYTPNLASHAYLSDLGAHAYGSPATLASKTATGGAANAANPVFNSVPAGPTYNYIVIYKSTGVASTSPLIALIDTASNLPATPNGGNLTVDWDTGNYKIFSF